MGTEDETDEVIMGPPEVTAAPDTPVPSELSLRSKILSDDHVVTKLVDVPEWDLDSKLEIHGLSVGEVASVSRRLTALGRDRRMELATPFWVIAGTYDPATGKKVFSDDDADLLTTQSSKPMNTLATEILQISGVTTAALQQVVDKYLKALDDEETTEEERALALVALRRVVDGEATPTGEA